MKILLTFAGLLAIAYTLRVPQQPQPIISGVPIENVQGTVNIQRIVLNLLQNIDQPNSSQEIEKIGLNYDIEANIQNYKNPQYVVDFFKLFTVGALPKGQIFSIYNQQHQIEAIAFYRLLSSAVDIDTFYKTAAWGRMFLNEGLYLYSVSVALVHRPDTTNVELPPIYEIYPYYFYNVEVFQQIQQRLGLSLIHSQPRSYKLPYYFGKYIQNQQGQGIFQQGQGIFQRGQGLYQQEPIQYQGPYQYQKPIQYQQGFNQYQVPLQSQYGIRQQEQQIPVQFQQYQQGPMQWQQGLPLKQQGSIQWLQGLLQNQVPYQQQQQQGQSIPYSQQYFQRYLQGQQYQGVPTQQYGEIYGRQGIFQQMRQGPVGQQQIPQQQGLFEQQVPQQQGLFGRQQELFGQQVPQQQLGQQYGIFGQQNVPLSQQYGNLWQSIQNGQQIPVSQYQIYLQRLQQQLQGGQESVFGQIPTVGVNPTIKNLNNYLRSRLSTKTPIVNQYPQGVVGVQEREKVPLWQNFDSEVLTIQANYTQVNPLQTPESLMNYFTEDVGLNAFYYYFNIYFPFWMSNEEINFNTERRGEQFYFIYQQLLARYNLERISNNLPEVPIVTSQRVMESGFQSELVNPNGIPFPIRPNNAPISYGSRVTEQVYDNYTMGLMNMRLYGNRILEAIDSGFVLTREGKFVPISEPQGIEILGNLIQVNPESPNPRYYGDMLRIARNIWGYSNYPVDQYDVVPSAMEQLETSLRDPAFYQLIKRMLSYFQRYQQYLPSYNQEQLLLNGVQIQDVKVDKLVTYFDNFYSDISIAMPSQVPIQISQRRLNYLPFNYYLNVVSETPIQAVVRVFLGPKYGVNGQPIDINKERLNFVQLDKFQVNLVAGLNNIQRSSIEFNGVVPERTTSKDLFMQLIGIPQVPITQRIPLGIPQRLLLPRGTQEGQVYQMYFIITPETVTKSTVRNVLQQQTILPMDIIYDKLPLGYPFDRPIDESVFYVPNSVFQDVVIYNELNPVGQQFEGLGIYYQNKPLFMHSQPGFEML